MNNEDFGKAFDRIDALIWRCIKIVREDNSIPGYTFDKEPEKGTVVRGVGTASEIIAKEIATKDARIAELEADLAKCGADLQYEFDNPGDSRRRIAELESKDKARIRELITWIQIAVGPKDGMMAGLAAKAKIEALHKELEEMSE